MKRRIGGFIDPFALGFILSLLGAASVVTLEGQPGDDSGTTVGEVLATPVVETDSTEHSTDGDWPAGAACVDWQIHGPMGCVVWRR